MSVYWTYASSIYLYLLFESCANRTHRSLLYCRAKRSCHLIFLSPINRTYVYLSLFITKTEFGIKWRRKVSYALKPNQNQRRNCFHSCTNRTYTYLLHFRENRIYLQLPVVYGNERSQQHVGESGLKIYDEERSFVAKARAVLKGDMTDSFTDSKWHKWWPKFVSLVIFVQTRKNEIGNKYN